MKARGQFRTLLLLGSIAGNILFGLYLWDYRAPEETTIEKADPLATPWQHRIEKQALKRRVLALEQRLIEAQSLPSRNRIARKGGVEEFGASKTSGSRGHRSLEAPNLSDKDVTRAVEGFIAQLELPKEEEEDEDGFVYESEGTGSVLIGSGHGGTLIFEDEEEIEFERSLLIKFGPFLSQKEALFRGLLNIYVDPKQEDRHYLVLDSLNTLREFIGGEDEANRVVLDFLNNSKLDGKTKLSLIGLTDFVGTEGESTAIEVLQSLANHSNDNVRKKAIEELLAFDYSGRSVQFEAFARDASETEEIRCLGIYGSNIGSKEVVRLLVGLSRDSSDKVRHTAVCRLAETSDKARRALFQQLILEEKEHNILYALGLHLTNYGDAETLNFFQSQEQRAGSNDRRKFFKTLRVRLERNLNQTQNQ